MKKSILIVDDDNLTCSLLSPLLKDNCTEVFCASNGEDALRRLGTVSFDLCFIDMCLPEMSGIDFMRAIKGIHPATGIITMTSGAPADDAMKAIRKHALLHLVKPFDLFQVKAFVKEFLGKHIDTYQDYNSLMASICGEKRLHDRQPFTNPGNYAILLYDMDDDEQRYVAASVDLCVNGLGITTNVQLEPGKIIRLRNGNEHVRGIVRWITPLIRNERYRVGIEFV